MADINRCTERYLTGVLKLDRRIASRIIRYKRKVGTLKHIDELLRVKGITRHIFDLISSNLQVKDQKETAVGETLPYEVTGSTLLSSNNSQENDIDNSNGIQNSVPAKNKYNLRREGVNQFQASGKKRTAASKGRPTKRKDTICQTSKRRCRRDYRKIIQPTSSKDIKQTNAKKDNVFMLTPLSIELSPSGEMLTIMYKSPEKMFRGRKHGQFDARELSNTTVSTVVIEEPDVSLNESQSDIMKLSNVATGKTSCKRRRSGAYPSGKSKGYKKRRIDGKNKEQQSEAQEISKEPPLLNNGIPIENKLHSVEKWISTLPVEIECAKVNANGEVVLGGKKVDEIPEQPKERSDEPQPGPSGIDKDKNGNTSMEYGFVPVPNNELFECSKQILFESIGLIEKKESNLVQNPNINNKISETKIPAEKTLSKLQDIGQPVTPVVENVIGNNDPSTKLKYTDRTDKEKSERSVVKEKEHNKERGHNEKERKDDRKDNRRERREDRIDEKGQKSGLKKDEKDKRDEKKSEKIIGNKKDDQSKQREKKSSSKEKVEETKKSGGGWSCVLL